MGTKKIVVISTILFSLFSACKNSDPFTRTQKVDSESQDNSLIIPQNEETWATKFPSLWSKTAYAQSGVDPKSVTYEQLLNDLTTQLATKPEVKGPKGDKGDPGPKGETSSGASSKWYNFATFVCHRTHNNAIDCDKDQFYNFEKGSDFESFKNDFGSAELLFDIYLKKLKKCEFRMRSPNETIDSSIVYFKKVLGNGFDPGLKLLDTALYTTSDNNTYLETSEIKFALSYSNTGDYFHRFNVKHFAKNISSNATIHTNGFAGIIDVRCPL